MTKLYVVRVKDRKWHKRRRYLGLYRGAHSTKPADLCWTCEQKDAVRLNRRIACAIAAKNKGAKAVRLVKR